MQSWSDLEPAWREALRLAWEAYGVPHLAFHAAHTEPYSTSDNVLNLVALALAVVAPVVAGGLVWSQTRSKTSPDLGAARRWSVCCPAR